MSGNKRVTADDAPSSAHGGKARSPVADKMTPPEEGLSLREAARSLYTGRHDPDLDVDMRIASSMGGILWIGAGVLCLLMLPISHPDRALGPIGWLVAALAVAGAFVIGAQRLSRSPSSAGALYAGNMLAVLGIALLEWLAGGRLSPYHQLYALPVIYAATVQSRRRAVMVLAFVAVVAWAPLLYAAPGRDLPADIAGQLLLLVVVAIAGRIVFTLLRAQRAGLRRTREQAHELARRDPLTGLGNRLHLEETLEVEVARARRQSTPLSLIIGDLDGFKAINDEFGHAGGDECLRRVGQAVEGASRTEDQCFRWGGDEFVVVLPDTDGQRAAEVRRRVCSAASVSCTSPVGDAVRLSCGTAQLGSEDTVQSLLAAADEALLRIKRCEGEFERAESDGASDAGGAR